MGKKHLSTSRRIKIRIIEVLQLEEGVYTLCIGNNQVVRVSSNDIQVDNYWKTKLVDGMRISIAQNVDDTQFYRYRRYSEQMEKTGGEIPIYDSNITYDHTLKS